MFLPLACFDYIIQYLTEVFKIHACARKFKAFDSLLQEVKSLIQLLPEMLLNLVLPGQEVFGRPLSPRAGLGLQQCCLEPGFSRSHGSPAGISRGDPCYRRTNLDFRRSRWPLPRAAHIVEPGRQACSLGLLFCWDVVHMSYSSFM